MSESWYKCDGVCTPTATTRWRVWVGVWRVWVSESWYKCDGVCTLQLLQLLLLLLLLGGGCGWVCGGCG